jgi:hypothetical protein
VEGVCAQAIGAKNRMERTSATAHAHKEKVRGAKFKRRDRALP